MRKIEDLGGHIKEQDVLMSDYMHTQKDTMFDF